MNRLATLSSTARRRLGGAALVLAGLVVAGVVLASVTGGEDDPPRPVMALRTVAIPPLGLAFAHPDEWSRTPEGKVLRLASADKSVVMTFASPTAGRRAAAVKKDMQRELRRQLRAARVVGEGPGSMGGRTVDTFEMTGRRGKESVRVLGIVETTQYRTYAVTTLTPARPSRRGLAQVSAVLDSVRLSKPSGADRR